MTRKWNDLQIEGLLFDYGGTLDTGGRHWANVLQDAFHHIGINIDSDTFRQAYVYGERTLASQNIISKNDNFLALLLKKIKLETDYVIGIKPYLLHADKRIEIESCIADYCYEVARKETRNSLRVLGKLHSKYPIAMVTNFYGNMAAVLSDFGLKSLFQTIVESATAGVRKPDPTIWQLGVSALNLSPEKVLVIGDSYEKDILPAQSIGCRTAWFKGEEWKPSHHDTTIPDIIIESISDLLPLAD